MQGLVLAAEKYSDYYRIEEDLSVFHHAVSCTTSQQVRFSVGRQTRQALYRLVGYPLKPLAVQSLDWTEIPNLTPGRVKLILRLCELALRVDDDEFLRQLPLLSGVGPWTVKAVQLLAGKNEQIALYEDAYVRARLGEYLSSKLTMASARVIMEGVQAEKKSLVSYLLWRIRPGGVTKLKQNLPLIRDDFL